MKKRIVKYKYLLMDIPIIQSDIPELSNLLDSADSILLTYESLQKLKRDCTTIQTATSETNTSIQIHNANIPTNISLGIDHILKDTPQTEEELNDYVFLATKLKIIDRTQITLLCDLFLMAHIKTNKRVLNHMIPIFMSTENKTILNYYTNLRKSMMTAKYKSLIELYKKTRKDPDPDYSFKTKRRFVIPPNKFNLLISSIQTTSCANLPTHNTKLPQSPQPLTIETQIQYLITQLQLDHMAEPRQQLNECIFAQSINLVCSYLKKTAQLYTSSIATLFLIWYAVRKSAPRSIMICQILGEISPIIQDYLERIHTTLIKHEKKIDIHKLITDYIDLATGYYLTVSEEYCVSSMNRIMREIQRTVVSIVIRKVTAAVMTLTEKEQQSIILKSTCNARIKCAVKEKLRGIIDSPDIKDIDCVTEMLSKL